LALIVSFTFKNSPYWYRSHYDAYTQFYQRYGFDLGALLFAALFVLIGILLLLYSIYKAVKHFEFRISDSSIIYTSNRKNKTIKLADVGRIIVAQNKKVTAEYATSQAPMGYITVFHKDILIGKLLNISLPESGVDVIGISDWVKGHLDKEGFKDIKVEIPSDNRFGGA
jgi:hypothetical protein